MAQDYMKLMRQFALAVSGANDSLSDSSLLPVEKTTSAIDDFFPFCGITIGKTTCKEVEEMGYPVIKWPDGSVSVSSGEGLFYDHDRNGFFTALSMGDGSSSLLNGQRKDSLGKILMMNGCKFSKHWGIRLM